MRDFKKLQVWQIGMDVVDMVFDLCSRLPLPIASGIINQMTRCSVSMPSNTAEGNSRRSERDKHRYMEIAYGSAFELETQLMITQRRHWVPDEDVQRIIDRTIEFQKATAGFMAKLGA